jgi:hypothetical protein
LDEQRLGDDLFGGEAGIESGSGLLQYHLDGGAQARAVLARGADEVLAVANDFAGIRLFEHGDAARKGRFAGAGGADDGERAAAVEGEIDGGEGRLWRMTKALGERAHGQQRLRGHDARGQRCKDRPALGRAGARGRVPRCDRRSS